MKEICFLILAAFAVPGLAQTRTGQDTTAIPAIVPIKPADTLEAFGGKVEGRTYQNEKFRFEITLPDDWFIAGNDFDEVIRKKGIDLSLRPPANLPLASRSKLNKAVRDVSILMTAFRDDKIAKDGAILRVSSESLASDPQIKDAVDYFDAMRATYRSLTLPPDFKYSETQAEKLGHMQFGFLDTSSKAGKKRLYATVRQGCAVLFTLSYSKESDLEAFRAILANGNFSLRAK